MNVGAEIRLSTDDELRCYLSGAARDGTYSRAHNTLRITQKGMGWPQTLQMILRQLGRKSWIYEEGNRGVFTVETTWHQPIEPSTMAELRAFARGYFDAEGGIPRDPDSRFYVQYVQKDLEDLRTVQRCLEEVGIACGRIHNPSVLVDPDYWRFFVRAASHRDFCEIVSSWHPRKRPLLERRLQNYRLSYERSREQTAIP